MKNKVRIQKFLSQAGICSRRKAEELIQQGLVSVNKKVVTELGTKIDPDKDIIHVEGSRIKTEIKKVTILLYKPKGYVTTLSDPQERPTVQDLIKKTSMRLFPVGRLDFNSEGLLLLTNDGEMSNTLTHPQHQIEKVYWVKVQGKPSESKLKRLRRGIKLEDGPTAPCKVKILSHTETNCWLEIVLKEGRNRQIRRMIEAIGYNVLKLKRARLAGLTLEGLKPGEYRLLTPQEIKTLKTTPYCP